MATASLAEVLLSPQLCLPQVFCSPEVPLTLVGLIVQEASQLLAALAALVVDVEGMPSFHSLFFLRFASP